MATPSMDITSFVGKLLEQDDVDALREGVRVLAEIVMDTEVSAQIGAGHYERSLERTAYPLRCKASRAVLTVFEPALRPRRSLDERSRDHAGSLGAPGACAAR